jgi:hypothetical protein
MTYFNFLKGFLNETIPGQMVMRHQNLDHTVVVKLLQDMEMPSFYSDIVELEGFEIMQGSHFIDKSHYKKKEQIMCVVDGHADIINVPHMYRQEVYVMPPDNQDSPISFFKPDTKWFEAFKWAKKETIRLEKGDCVFMPAYNFYQVQGYNLDMGQHFKFGDSFDQEAPDQIYEVKPIATLVSFVF